MFSPPQHILQIHAREIHERMHAHSRGQRLPVAPRPPQRTPVAVPPLVNPHPLARLRALLRHPGSFRRVAPPAR